MTDIDGPILNVHNEIKKKYCINCGKTGHNNRECVEPITSAGIILFKLDTEKINNKLRKNINIQIFIDKFNKIDNKKILLNETKNILDMLDENLKSILEEHIYFLMVQRRQTLGYIEFIRGRYDLSDIDTVLHLISQMTREELINIYTFRNNFDNLWNEIFYINRTYKDSYFEQEYINSKQRFKNLNDNGFLDIIYNYEPIFKNPEWGFPKGRRNYRENNINCAKRELKEETNLIEEDYNILSGIYPLIEIMTGTNEKKYKHIYYIGACDFNKNVYLNDENSIQKFEIGDIGWYNYKECRTMLRDYHIEKKKILSIVFSFIVGQILKQNNRYVKNKSQIWKKETKIIKPKQRTNQLNL